MDWFGSLFNGRKEEEEQKIVDKLKGIEGVGV
jgi:hypothetical protein